MKSLKFLRLGKPIVFYGLLCSIIGIFVLFLFGIDKYRIVGAACNVALALMGALFGVVLNPGNYKFDNWFDEDIIDDFLINDLNKEMSMLKAEIKYTKNVKFLFNKRFTLLKDTEAVSKTTNDTNTASDITGYEYITFLAKNAFEYEYKKNDGTMKPYYLHLKIIFRSPLYKSSKDLSRKRIYTSCTIYSNFPGLNDKISGEICSGLDSVIDNNRDLKEIIKLKDDDTSHFDDIFIEDRSIATYSEAKKAQGDSRPVQYWIENIIAPERIKASSEDFNVIMRMLIIKLNLYIKEISYALQNKSDSNGR